MLSFLVFICVFKIASIGGGEGGGGVNRFSDRRISQKKFVRITDLANVLHGFRILLIQKIADLSNILARIADFASNLGGFVYSYSLPPPL